MVKHLITEISEEDFRKLNIKVYRHEREESEKGSFRFVMKEHYINDILDKQIKFTLESGYESDLEDLKTPVTIAIHEEPTKEDYERVRKEHPWFLASVVKNTVLYAHSYLDKFMNQYTGAQTFQIGWGIKHLYSTRDYYEMRGDYWRVSKKETKVIYRVHLDEKWQKQFFLKHYKKIVKNISGNQWIETSYDYNYEKCAYIPVSSTLVTKNEYSTSYEPIELTLPD